MDGACSKLSEANNTTSLCKHSYQGTTLASFDVNISPRMRLTNKSLLLTAVTILRPSTIPLNNATPSRGPMGINTKPGAINLRRFSALPFSMRVKLSTRNFAWWGWS